MKVDGVDKRVRMLLGCGVATLVMTMAGLTGASPAWGASYQALVGSGLGLTQIDTSTNAIVGSDSSGARYGVAITPDDTTAYTTARDINSGDGELIPYTLSSGNPVAGSAQPYPGSPSTGISNPGSAVVIAPDGATLWVADPQRNVVLPFDLNTHSYGTAVSIPDIPVGLAVSPDSSTVYVLDANDRITTIDASTEMQVGSPLQLTGAQDDGTAIAISPDGSHLYVTDDNGVLSTAVIAVATSPSLSQGPEATLPLQPSTGGIAVSPDGATAYVEGANTSGDAAVAAVGLGSTLTAGTPLDLGSGTSAQSLAVTPDGAAVYATAEVGGGGEVVPLALSGSGATTTMTPGTAITSGIGDADAIAVTPDQPPVPAFTVTPGAPGAATDFNASASTAAYGSITSYHWVFGDGTSTTMTSATTTHVYSAGSYTATLTVTDSAGKSASTSHAVVISGGTTPTFSPSTGSLAFGSVDLGMAGGAQTLTITNTGGAPLAIAADSVGGADPGDFSLSADHCAGQTIAAGGTCTVTVAFTPAAGGARTAALSFTDDATGSPQAIMLAGTGVAATAVPSTTSLAFGTVGVNNSSAPQSVTLGNQGNAPLSVTGARIAGADASDYAITSDGCAAATVAPGTSCTVTVTFTPSQTGTRTAALTFADSASGAAASVALSGTGTATGTLTGAITDSARSAVNQASVTACPVIGGVIGGGAGMGCLATKSDASGHYTFIGLTPGPWALDVEPAQATLYGASARLTVVAGTQTEDVMLSAPQPLPAGFSVLSSLGEDTGGVPTVSWSSPFELSYPVSVPTGPGNKEDVVITTMAIYGSGASDADQAPVASGSLILTVDHAASGAPSIATATPDPGSGPDPNIEFSGDVGGSMRRVTARARSAPAPRLRPHDLVPDGVQVAYLQDFTPAPLPNNQTTVTATTSLNESAHGPQTMKINDTTLQVPAGSTVTIGPDGTVTIKVGPCSGSDCPYTPPCQGTSCQPNKNSSASVDVDPSGEIKDTKGLPVPGARVVLTHAAVKNGRYEQVPDHSTLMSRATRRDPITTGANGLFAWDVMPGWYQVQTNRSGCTAPHKKIHEVRSRPLYVPPPALGVNLTLACPHLTRAKSTLRLTTATLDHKRYVVLTAAVRGSKRHHPTGLVTFTVNGHRRITLPIDPRTGRAIDAVPASSRSSYSAAYDGDGYNQPAQGRNRRDS